MRAILLYLCVIFANSMASSLHEAISEGADVNRIRCLLTYNNIDEKNEAGLTALHVAVTANNKAGCEYLLESGADFELTDGHGATPLIYAVTSGDVEMLKLFLDKGADANGKVGVTRKTALHIAARRNHPEIFQTLLLTAPNVDVNVVDNSGWSALQYAAEKGYVEIVNMHPMIETEVGKDYVNRRTALHRAAINGYHDVIYSLMGLQTIINDRDMTGATPIHYAAKYGHVKCFLALFASGANLLLKDLAGNTPLLAAVIPDRSIRNADFEERVRFCRRSAEIVKIILKMKLDLWTVDGNGCTAELLAYRYGNFEAYAALKKERLVQLTAGKEGLPHLHREMIHKRVNLHRVEELLKVDPNERDHLGRTFLHFVVEADHVEAARVALTNGCDPMLKDAMGNTPLHVVTSVDIARMLLERNPAAANVANKFGNLPVHCQCNTGNLEVIRALLPVTDDIKARNDQKLTPLDVATVKGNVHVAELLLNHGAAENLNLQLTNPLHLAAGKNYPLLVQLFLNRGFDPTATGRNGNTAAHYAVGLAGNFEILRMVLARTKRKVVNIYGCNLLHYAVLCKSSTRDTTVQYLLKSGVPIDAATYSGRTALFYAAYTGHATTVEILLRHGADTRITSLGKNPVHAAVFSGFPECVELLTNADHDLIRMQDLEGKTPLDNLLLGYSSRSTRGKKMLEAMTLTGSDIPETNLERAIRFLSTSFVHSLDNLQAIITFEEYVRQGVTHFRRDHIPNDNVAFDAANADIVRSYMTHGMGTFYSVAAAYYPQLAALEGQNRNKKRRECRKMVQAFEAARQKMYYVKFLKYNVVEIFLKEREKILKGTYMDFIPSELIEDVLMEANNGNILGKIDLAANSLMLALNHTGELDLYRDYLGGKMARISELAIRNIPKNTIQTKRRKSSKTIPVDDIIIID